MPPVCCDAQQRVWELSAVEVRRGVAPQSRRGESSLLAATAFSCSFMGRRPLPVRCGAVAARDGVGPSLLSNSDDLDFMQSDMSHAFTCEM